MEVGKDLFWNSYIVPEVLRVTSGEHVWIDLSLRTMHTIKAFGLLTRKDDGFHLEYGKTQMVLDFVGGCEKLIHDGKEYTCAPGTPHEVIHAYVKSGFHD